MWRERVARIDRDRALLAEDREDVRIEVVAFCGAKPDARHGMAEAPSSCHHIEIRHRAVDQRRVRRGVTGKRQRLGSDVDLPRWCIVDPQPNAGAIKNAQRSIDAGKRRERSIARHRRHADAPVEAAEVGTGRRDRDLRGFAAAVLPAGAAIGGYAKDRSVRVQCLPRLNSLRITMMALMTALEDRA